MADLQFLKQPGPIFNRQAIIGTLVVFLSLFLIIDLVRNNALFFQNPDHLSFKAKNGNYVCCDKNKGEILIADRYMVGDWEQFTIRKQEGGYLTFISSEGKRVGTDNQNNLKGISGRPENSSLWRIEQKGDSIVVGDKNGRYWHLAGDSRVVTGPRANADSFIRVDFNKVIPLRDYFLVIMGFMFLVMAIVFFQTRLQPWIALLFLMMAAFFLTLYCIRIFDFLMIWDEQYHALVARNMILHPFKPMLYSDPVLAYDYKNWIGNSIWLHKQPLFLWQMAFSIWIFGAKAWAVRFPDLVMAVLMIPVIYRMGRIVADNRTGFWAAVFFTVSHFLFRLITGATFTDHNDVAFLFYVTLSLWSWLEYEYRDGESGQLKFVILTGLLAGAAVLVKWLPGLLVYSGWGLSLILSGRSRKVLKCYLHLVFSFLITVIVALPWQIYILMKFPLESRFEFNLTSSHFLNPIEGHSGDGLGWYYYIENFRDVFSVSQVTWAILAILFVLIAKRKKLAVSLLLMLAIVFVFYSAAATKMPAFTFITLPIILLVYASLFTVAERFLAIFVSSRFLRILLMTAIIINIAGFHYRLNEKYSGFYAERGNTQRCIAQREKFAGLYREMGTIIPAAQQSGFIIINCPWEEIPHLMFYTTIRAAYNKIDDNQLIYLKSRKDLKIGYIVFSDEAIPDNISRDPSILKIRFSKSISVNDLGKCLQ
jgi:4-amino-4-deoxy-L-arabinose transferase-like glycosyltransferase